MAKDIISTATFTDRDGRILDVKPNVAFRYVARARIISKWNAVNAGSAPWIWIFPWKAAYLLADDDITVGHSAAAEAVDTNYPHNITGSNTAMASPQYGVFRWSAVTGNVAASAVPRVFAGVMTASQFGVSTGTQVGMGDGIGSHVDVPLDYTQIGIVYFHPAHQQSNTFTTTTGSSFVTFTNAQFWDGLYIAPGVFSIVRIETGADAGYYFVSHLDNNQNRLYLRHLDGAPFIAQGSATVTATAAPGRRAWFNETGVIPLSVGTLSTSGRYNPRNGGQWSDPMLRESFICRLTVEKTGSTEAAVGTEQQGSYLMSLRPFTHGSGALTEQPDSQTIWEGAHLLVGTNSYTPPWTVHWAGGCNGAVLDWANQRLWAGIVDNSNNSSLHVWRWKTSEGWREVATNTPSGVAPQASYLNPTPVLGAADQITSIEMGSTTGSTANWVYVAINHASGGNGGLIIIKPDRTTLQYTTTSGAFPAAQCAGMVVDPSRARTGSTGDTSTDGSNNVTTASGRFTNSDIGRAIKLTGLGADSGTYKISSIGGATTVGVQTLAGGPVTFTSQSGGTYEVGDRVYFFFNNGTTGAGTINYMESLAPGTWMTRAVSMTNGTTINVRVTGATGIKNGMKQCVALDRASGNVYWLSNDTQQQVNKYDVVANTHSLIAISNTSLLSPAGGVVVGGASPATNPGTPTYFSAIAVNSKFDDIWVGSNAGHFRIPKSTFSASGIRRYFGSDNGTYVYGVPQVTGTGNGVSGLTFSTPNVTLNATGTPFTPQMVGKYIVITGASTAGNNGVFPITAYNSTSSITYTNTSGATQANYGGTFHIVNRWNHHSNGSAAGISGDSQITRHFAEAPDGRMWAQSNADNSGNAHYHYFSQESDNWHRRGEWSSGNGNETSWFSFVEPHSGRALVVQAAAGAPARMVLPAWEIQHQWDGSKWLPLEWVQNETPNKGNNTPTDGATTLGSATFTGSGFAAADVGKYLRIESGADIGIYRIGTYTSGTSVDLVKLDGMPFAAAATAGTLSYTKTACVLGRPIHSTAQEVAFGVKVAWNRQGGATPPNNEFLGRGGQSRMTASDGTTTSGSSTFGGSGFVAGDVGKLLRIEGGSGLLTDEYKTYRIATYISAAAVTLRNLNGATFNASANTTGMTYSVWDPGTPGSNAGPENITFMLADGFGKDNTQDLGGIAFDSFGWKARFYEQEEQRKFAVENPLALPGPLNISPAMRLYYETYARVTRSAPTTGGQYDPALSHHRALPSSEFPLGRQMLDFGQDKFLEGTAGRADMNSSPGNLTDWHGIVASNAAMGASVMVDLGKDAEVGFIMMRFQCIGGTIGLQMLNASQHGMLANLYNATHSGGTPVASYTQHGTGDTIGGAAPNMTWTDAGAAFTAADVGRYITIQAATTPANNGTFLITAFTSGTQITYTNASGVAEAATNAKWFITSATARTSGLAQLSATADNTTLTLGSGDFLGSVTTGPFSNGQITATQNTFVAPAATFVPGDYMRVLRITAGASLDLGSYRIIAVSLDGSTVTVRNLNQTAVAWNGSASGITYEVRNGVREEDQIIFWDSGGAPARCCVERLLTTTTAQVRTAPSALATNVNWWAFAPTWNPVKRLSVNTEAQPPDTKNNGTWMSGNANNRDDLLSVLMYFDLTDLPASQRTARWWKWAGQPKFAGDSGSDASFRWTSMEFYDPSGNKLGQSRYTSTDQARTNPDFFFSWLSRVDFIQSANDALAGVAAKNGNADLGGGNGDTITLNTGGNKFLGFQIGPTYTDGNPVNGGNTFNSATAAFPASATPGRFLWIQTGTNAGYYRILTRVSATQVTVGPPSGVGSTVFSPTETGLTFSIHEGIAVGGTYPDKFVFRRLGTAGDVTTTVATNQLNSASGGFTDADRGKLIRVWGATNDNGTYLIVKVNSATQVLVTTSFGDAVSFVGGTGGSFEVDSDLREYSIAAINDALTTITISESLSPALTNKPWEIRRPAYDTTSTTTEASKFARLTRLIVGGGTMPVQSGDIGNDRSGHLRFFSEDIGGSATAGAGGYQRADGVIAGGSGAFTGSGFSPDDVGRLLYIDTGANMGVYEISVFTSSTAITVKNHYTGAAVSLTADAGPVTYRVFGDRRFRLTKYATGLRA